MAGMTVLFFIMSLNDISDCNSRHQNIGFFWYLDEEGLNIHQITANVEIALLVACCDLSSNGIQRGLLMEEKSTRCYLRQNEVSKDVASALSITQPLLPAED
jgi:hypothetical protein